MPPSRPLKDPSLADIITKRTEYDQFGGRRHITHPRWTKLNSLHKNNSIF